MPRKKAAKPLQTLCLENVAANMQPIWAKAYMDRGPHVLGPFSELDDSLVQELIGLMGTNRQLTRPMMHLFLVPQLTELDLSKCSKLVTGTVTQMITSRCKNLSSLCLQGCILVPSKALVALVESLPGIKKLNLSETQCNTQVLSAVGSTCQQLCELDISDCKQVSPESLFHLAYNVTARSCCCQELKILLVEYLEPIDDNQEVVCALAFLLLALPNLQVLKNSCVDEAVQQIHCQEFSQEVNAPGFPPLEEIARGRVAKAGTSLTLSLKEMLEIEVSFFPVIRTMCPHLEKVCLYESNDSDWDPGSFPRRSFCDLTLESFSAWHTLTDLEVDFPRKLSEVLPIASLLGAQLRSLSLSGFFAEDEVSFHTLLSHCPNLQKFSATIRIFPQTSAPLVTAVTPLHLSSLADFHLSLITLCSEPAPATARWQASLVCVLRNAPVLERLELFSLPFGLDEVFKEVLEGPVPALLHLRFLSLVDCKVAVGTIHLLLSADNPLESLLLEMYPEMEQGAFDGLLRRVSVEGYDVQIQKNTDEMCEDE